MKAHRMTEQEYTGSSWLGDDEAMDEFWLPIWQCSCGAKFGRIGNFCPHCGASLPSVVAQ